MNDKWRSSSARYRGSRQARQRKSSHIDGGIGHSIERRSSLHISYFIKMIRTAFNARPAMKHTSILDTFKCESSALWLERETRRLPAIMIALSTGEAK